MPLLRTPAVGAAHSRRAAIVRGVWLSAAVVVALLVTGAFLRFHREGQGFTYVLDFGGSLGLPRLPEVDSGAVYIHPQVPGYDGQMYAQLALRPAATDPQLTQVLDNPPYRARRILMPWVAHVLGLGRASWVLNAEALLNLAVWFALAVLLLRWFRPTSWTDFVRWCGVMLSAGMLSSLRHALTDGPALLALAACLACVESGRRRLAVVAGAAAGLTRETSLLVGAVLVPDRWRDGRGWLRAALEGLAMAAPLALWMWHVSGLGKSGVYDGGGFANFTWPFAGFLERWRELLVVLFERGWLRTHGFATLLHAAITVQALVVVVRPRWSDPWWRVAAAHVLLLASLNSQVWEDYPGAAARVLLPLLLAFNQLVPARGFWAFVLIAGNLGVFSGVLELRAPPQEIVHVRVDAAVPEAGRAEPPVVATVGAGFLVLEGAGVDSWRWTDGDAEIRLENRAGRPLMAILRATVRSRQAREIEVRVGDAIIGQWSAGPVRTTFGSDPFPVPPEGVAIRFHTGVAEPGPVGTGRSVAVEFSGIDLEVAARP